jgi:NhaA family Na+:H+ antiporter
VPGSLVGAVSARTKEIVMSAPEPPFRNSWLSSERALPRLIARPLRVFLNTEAAGGIVLLGATVAALVLANSPLADSYESLWRTDLRIAIGSFEVAQDVRHWVNDGLMAIFFFVVGLEIKRELVAGELNDMRKAMIPVVAAAGGMVAPALVYLAFNAGGAGAAGWGIPMATDIAFAVGVLALLSNRVPSGLKVFLLSLAIVDDIGAILVIALFYSGGIKFGWLLAAIGLLAVIAVLRRLKVYWTPVYVVVGISVWLATFESGVHATIAGAALGLLAPARPTDPRGFADVFEEAIALSAEPDAEALRAAQLQSKEVVSVAERLEHLLHPWTSYFVIPLFALANAGLVLSVSGIADALSSEVAIGIVGGLVVGKTIGISTAVWLAVRLKLGRLPDGVQWRHVVGASTVAGIGFTVSLFITALAFDDTQLIAEAKIGVFLASLLAGLAGAAVLAIGHRQRGDQEQD